MLTGIAVACRSVGNNKLTAETVEGAALTFERVHHVHGGDGLPLGVFGVGDGVPDYVLEEDLEHASRLLVDQSGYALDAATTGQTSYRGLGDALDVVAQDLAMTLGATLSKSLAALSSTGHLAITFL
jgi:hypothetical protein